jgi:hypothetical protein
MNTEHAQSVGSRIQITPERFHALIRELTDENPFAVRAVLRIASVTFTDRVPTLAVTLEERPRLLVNLDFVQAYCRTDAHVKALLCHEYLHVLLGHTERFRTMTPALNLALDSVINAIIHRQLGAEYSGFMSAYYADEPGLGQLLRPMTKEEQDRYNKQLWGDAAVDGDSSYKPERVPTWMRAWDGVCTGRLVADDILDLAQEMRGAFAERGYLGNHEDRTGPLPPALADALDEAMREMNGDGIWRMPRDRGVGPDAYEAVVRASDEPTARWRRMAFEALRECLLPDPRSRLTERAETSYALPVLNERDRRGFLRALWSPFLPDVQWRSSVERPQGSANVYLDVSGSMMAEMPHIVALLHRLRHAVRMPFWAFSNVVARAEIVSGRLVAQTTGGTSMNCVLAHVRETKPGAALVVTDGYIEEVDRALLASIRGTRLHALVTRDGSTTELERAGIPYRQLERLPT